MEDGRRFDAGRRCLALLAAEPDRPEALARWLVDCGLVPEGTPLDAVDAGWVERFASLRDDVDALVRAELATRPATGPTAAAVPPAATGAPDPPADAAPAEQPHPAPHPAPA
ncbi:ABATE domain-containing protein, partial [Streptomyces sp. NPDC052644]